MRILIIDGQTEFSSSLSNLMGTAHQISTCASHAEGMSTLQNGDTDVVVVLHPKHELYLRSQWTGDATKLKSVLERMTGAAVEVAREGRVLSLVTGGAEFDRGLNDTVDAVERDLIFKAMQKTGGNQVRAAALLKITRGTLQYKLKKHAYPGYGESADPSAKAA